MNVGDPDAELGDLDAYSMDAMMQSDDQGLMWRGLKGSTAVSFTFTAANQPDPSNATQTAQRTPTLNQGTPRPVISSESTLSTPTTWRNRLVDNTQDYQQQDGVEGRVEDGVHDQHQPGVLGLLEEVRE